MLRGYVYNLTAFAALHPGGLERLLEVAGRDASNAFAAAPHPRQPRCSSSTSALDALRERAPKSAPSRA